MIEPFATTNTIRRLLSKGGRADSLRAASALHARAWVEAPVGLIAWDADEREMIERYLRKALGVAVAPVSNAALGNVGAPVVVMRVSTSYDTDDLAALNAAGRAVVALVDDPAGGIRAYEHGADIVCLIPVDLDLLSSAVRSLLHRTGTIASHDVASSS